MTKSTSWRLLAVVGLGTGAYLGAPDALSPVMGVGPASAKAFYTRKRVNGAWVEGRFPKAGLAKARPSRRGRIAATKAAPPPPPSPLPPRPERGSVDGAAAVTASLGAERLSRLQSALEAKAQAIAATPALPAAEPRPAAAAPTMPRSVTFDFETGLKTTQYGGDVAVREPFDAAAMRALASPPPAVPGPALSAGLPQGPDRTSPDRIGPDRTGPDRKSVDRLPGS